jgi:hypothetical protein
LELAQATAFLMVALMESMMALEVIARLGLGETSVLPTKTSSGATYLPVVNCLNLNVFDLAVLPVVTLTKANHQVWRMAKKYLDRCTRAHGCLIDAPIKSTGRQHISWSVFTKLWVFLMIIM